MARARKAAAAAVPAALPGDVLVTGFAPFGGDDVNPSWEICEGLAAAIGHARLHTRLVPTEFRRAIEVVAAAVEETEPALVILLGQAGGRAALSVERVAINVDDARIADNAGRQPVDEPVAASGPAAYFATVPIKAMVAAIREEGIPAEVSNSAGTFVCNHLFYGVLHFLAASGRPARAGFIHVPWLESQAVTRPGEPAMALATMVRGVEAAIAAALATREDVKMAAGSLD
ncbi:MAG TPA: pyroglutamyl-peptidase I [Usitatibacteraceae bacterium]|nr:pyroglutamyl-peptidase I [Usitatibacteraceae bacterium]HQY46968.1 pyroglutamyl-peptidase I [Usitatibacteraceae bacterium]HRA23389.1 pyroglutamyl-peptidase I [Usitatibacteraceae bacterium]